MKKIVVLALALLIFIPAQALALNGVGYPKYDGAELPANTLGGHIDSQNLLLAFDASGDYSYVEGGFLQACFFAFDETQDYYLELYLLVPENVAAGDRLSAQNDGCCVSLFEVSEDGQNTYYAGGKGGSPYPAETSFEIVFTNVTATDGAIFAEGTISASLSCIEKSLPAEGALAMENLHFSFSLPLSNAPAADSGEDAPEASAAPAFTLPPDAVKV